MQSETRSQAVYGAARTITGGPVHSWVYVIEADPGLKIGWTTQPHERLAALERKHGYVYVWACVPGTRETEHWLHEKYAALRLHGEWFRWDDDLIAACENGTLLDRQGGLCKFSRASA